MKTGLRIICTLIFVLGIVSCRRSSGPALTTIDYGFNLLVVVEGDVELKRDGWSDYHFTTFGTILHRGDQLYLADEAKAVVLCSNLTTWTVPVGVRSSLTIGCLQDPDPVLVRDKSIIGHTRSINDPEIPYIISPRATKLLGREPILRWNTVPGATNYSVSVNGGKINWKIETSSTDLVYSGEPLKPEETYLLIVETDNERASTEEDIPGLGFSLLNENEAVHLQKSVNRLLELELSNEAESFAQAQIYAGQGLFAEAILILEKMTESGNQRTAVYYTLGNLYQQIGLTRFAETHYLEAIELANIAENLEEQAIAKQGLGETYIEIGNVDEAIKWLKAAKECFEILGDAKSVAQLEQRIRELP